MELSQRSFGFGMAHVSSSLELTAKVARVVTEFMNVQDVSINILLFNNGNMKLSSPQML
jgi:hypothetical protein